MRKRIYLIDDDPVFTYLLAKIIETIDDTAEVEVFPDGDLAMSRIAGMVDDGTLLPDLIFLDLNMPVMDGWEFLGQYSKVHNRFSKAVVLYIISSTISPTEIERAGDYPFLSGLIIKPPDKSKISGILSTLVI